MKILIKKLLRVKLNNKEFQICLNNQNEYLFLEI